MKTNILLIAIGGLLGSVARYLSVVYFTKLVPGQFPFGTFVVNIVGCLVIGVIYGLSLRYVWFTSEWRLLLATGFCGGFTTFSAFALENIQLLREANYGTFALYSVSSFALGLAAVFMGMSLAKIP
jgi:fluoride exporter